METAPPTDQKILSRAKEKTHGLISLIADLLDLSRIEEGVICQEPVPVQIKSLLQNIQKFLGHQAEAKDQTLSLDFPKESLPDLNADPLALASRELMGKTRDGFFVERICFAGRLFDCETHAEGCRWRYVVQLGALEHALRGSAGAVRKGQPCRRSLFRGE